MQQLTRCLLTTLCTAIAVSGVHAATDDIRIQSSNRSAVAAGVNAVATTGRLTAGALNAPIIIARYSPAAGTYGGVISVLVPRRVRGTVTMVETTFTPADGLRWSTGRAGFTYYGGVNPFGGFTNASFNASVVNGAFSGLTLPEFMVAVGHASRYYRAHFALIGAYVPQDERVGGTASNVYKTQPIWWDMRSASGTGAGTVVANHSLRWYVSVPENSAVADSFTAQYAVPGCTVSSSPKDRCVARAGVSFVPFNGTLGSPLEAASSQALSAFPTLASVAGMARDMVFLSSFGATGLGGFINASTAGSSGTGVTGMSISAEQLTTVDRDNEEDMKYQALATTLRNTTAGAFLRADLLSTTLTQAPLTVGTAGQGLAASLTTVSTQDLSTRPPDPAGVSYATAAVRGSGQSARLADGVGVQTIDGQTPVRKQIR